MKEQSVRSQRSFQEHMKTLYQNIDTLVYAAEVACHKAHGDEFRCPIGSDCPFHKAHHQEYPYGCALEGLRDCIGDHFTQTDIKEVELTE
jgi:predicted ArsR family transcriptional regulator